MDGSVGPANPVAPRAVGTLAAIEVLVICTGNMNRSPMGALVLADRLAARGQQATVASAGTQAALGGAAPEVIDILARAGIDASDFRSRQLEPEMIRRADLVLGMAREHVREAVVAVPEAFGRSFTLKELVRLGQQVGPRGVDEPLADWLARVGAGRTPRDLMGADPLDDVADPLGKRRSAFERAATEIGDLVDGLVALVAPLPVEAP